MKKVNRQKFPVGKPQTDKGLITMYYFVGHKERYNSYAEAMASKVFMNFHAGVGKISFEDTNIFQEIVLVRRRYGVAN